MSAGMVGYQYVTLRCVPRVDREEFLNVGVVLYSQAADFLEGAFDLDRERLRAAFPDLELDAVDASLAAICRVCRGEPGVGLPTLDKPGQRFGWLSAPRSTVIQPGPVHGGLTKDPAQELQRLVRALVN
ncbi:DUF3037 domain-containing protein [Oryzihumus leptocrescens]